MERARPRQSHWLIGSLGAVAAALIAAELLLRLVVGYGPLPKTMPDPAIEYLIAPSQRTYRFGDRYFINQWSMRSDEVSRQKTDLGECRVLVLGDSVVFGVSTDQSELATSRAEKILGERLGRSVRVLNASAPSWGPPNQLAYVRVLGAFDASAAVIVVSSHDYSDTPTGVAARASPPYLALRELHKQLLPGSDPPAAGGPSPGESVERATVAFRDLLTELRARRATPVVLFHSTRKELSGAPEVGRAVLGAITAALRVPSRDLAPAFRAAIDRGKTPYDDDIHLTEEGQAVLAVAIADAVQSLAACQG